MRPRNAFLLLALILVLSAPQYVRAEGFADLFAGVAFTPKNDVDLSAGGVTVTGESEFKDSFSVGARAGYWWSFFGVNLDFSYFRPELDPDDATVAGVTVKTDLDVWGLGLNAMLRGQFRSLRTSRRDDYSRTSSVGRRCSSAGSMLTFPAQALEGRVMCRPASDSRSAPGPRS